MVSRGYSVYITRNNLQKRLGEVHEIHVPKKTWLKQHDTVDCQGIISAERGRRNGRRKKRRFDELRFSKSAHLRGHIRPWRRFRAAKSAWRHSFDDVWSTAVNAPSRRFLQGTIMLGSLASTSCAFVHVHGGRAPRCTCARTPQNTGCP